MDRRVTVTLQVTVTLRHLSVDDRLIKPAMIPPPHFRMAVFNFHARVVRKPNKAISTLIIRTPEASNIESLLC